MENAHPKPLPQPPPPQPSNGSVAVTGTPWAQSLTHRPRQHYGSPQTTIKETLQRQAQSAAGAIIAPSNTRPSDHPLHTNPHAATLRAGNGPKSISVMSSPAYPSSLASDKTLSTSNIMSNHNHASETIVLDSPPLEPIPVNGARTHPKDSAVSNGKEVTDAPLSTLPPAASPQPRKLRQLYSSDTSNPDVADLSPGTPDIRRHPSPEVNSVHIKLSDIPPGTAISFRTLLDRARQENRRKRQLEEEETARVTSAKKKRKRQKGAEATRRALDAEDATGTENDDADEEGDTSDAEYIDSESDGEAEVEGDDDDDDEEEDDEDDESEDIDDEEDDEDEDSDDEDASTSVAPAQFEPDQMEKKNLEFFDALAAKYGAQTATPSKEGKDEEVHAPKLSEKEKRLRQAKVVGHYNAADPFIDDSELYQEFAMFEGPRGGKRKRAKSKTADEEKTKVDADDGPRKLKFVVVAGSLGDDYIEELFADHVEWKEGPAPVEKKPPQTPVPATGVSSTVNSASKCIKPLPRKRSVTNEIKTVTTEVDPPSANESKALSKRVSSEKKTGTILQFVAKKTSEDAKVRAASPQLYAKLTAASTPETKSGPPTALQQSLNNVAKSSQTASSATKAKVPSVSESNANGNSKVNPELNTTSQAAGPPSVKAGFDSKATDGNQGGATHGTSLPPAAGAALLRISSTPNSPAPMAGISSESSSPMVSQSQDAQQPINPEELGPLPPSVAPLMERLEKEVARTVFDTPTKFPERLKPILNELSLEMARVSEHQIIPRYFFDHLLMILPYNRYTLRRFILRKIVPLRVAEIQEEIEALQTEMKKHIEEKLNEVTASQGNSSAAPPNSEDGDGSLTTAAAAPGATGSAPGTPGITGETAPTDGESPSVTKFRFSEQLKRCLYAVVSLEVDIAFLRNELKSVMERQNFELSEMAVRKRAYAGLVKLWPPGLMTTTEISRAHSEYKVKIKKKTEKDQKSQQYIPVVVD